MKFQIGDEVRYGPSSNSFVIAQIRKNGRHIQYASEPWRLWHNEDELRKVEEPLKVGDLVEVIGNPMPLYAECLEHEIGRIFEITQEDTKNHEWFSCQCHPTYPPTSLRKLSPEEVAAHTKKQLVEDINIGDYVEVLYDGGLISKGTITKITDKKQDRLYSGVVFFIANDVRKLSPEEVAMHTGTIGYKIQEFQEKLDKARETLGMPQVSEIGMIHERLNWLQGQIDELKKDQTKAREYSDNLEKITVGDRIFTLDQHKDNAPIFSITKFNDRLIVDYKGEGMEIARRLLGAD